MRRAIERFFRLAEHGTSVRTEVLGGVTTFAAMAYIIVLNPAILKDVLPVGPSTVATILVAVFGCLLMGLTRIDRSRSRRTWARTRSSRSG